MHLLLLKLTRLHILYQYLGFRHPSNAFLILTIFYGMSWIRTNDGFPTDLQSVALTTQPLSLQKVILNQLS